MSACRRWASLGLSVALLAGCAMFRPASVPMRTISDTIREPLCTPHPATLLVMLPGSYSLPEEFQREGFVDIARAQKLSADVLLVDAHFAYYRNRSVIDRLAEDVIRPARARGYRRIWLVGISLGGVGAMLYANAHPEEVDGVVLIAPFLGEKSTAAQIERAGGLSRWTPPDAADKTDQIDTTLWRWLKTQTAAEPPAKRLPIFLGYGEEDRFRDNAEVLRAALPASRVFNAPGGHDWPAWRAVWTRIAATLPVTHEPPCSAAAR